MRSSGQALAGLQLNSSIRPHHMIYSLYYSLEGVIGPGGAIDKRRGELVAQAVNLARTAVDMLGDWVDDADWFDASGDESDVLSILDTEDEEELAAAHTRGPCRR